MPVRTGVVARGPAATRAEWAARVRRTDDRRAAADRWADGGLDTSPLLDSPFVLLGTPADLADQVARLGEVGVTYLTTFEPCAEALAVAVGMRA